MSERIGAGIERGEIAEATDEGYKVNSYTRNGIVTPPLHGAGGAVFQKGDKVYYFLYGDGTGAVLCKFEVANP